MFGFLKKVFYKVDRKPSGFLQKCSDYNTITFIEKLLQDVAKWKVISIILVFIACFFAINNKQSSNSIMNYGKDFIAVIEIDSVIQTDKHRTKVLEKLSENKNLKGVLLKINSPGGTITGSEILYNEIKKLSKIVPVYSLIYDVGASGGYMVALGSTKIFAHQTSITGSIGVLMQTLEAQELAKKIGARFRTYRSATYKAQPDSFEEPSEEIQKYMETAIKESHKFFENLVSVERKIPLSQISDVANGKIFMGNEAIVLKLIDDVSNEESVKQELLKQIGQKLDFKDISLKEDDKESFFSELIDEIIKKNKDTSSKVQVLAIMK